ncbi:MAG: metallophosphoesterase [Acidobacteriota bacterium]|nr:metallophosphoesterase [Acidobacteriota bacterium]
MRIAVWVLLSFSGYLWAQAPAYRWVELGSDGKVIARTISKGAECPQITLDGAARKMKARAAEAPEGFDVTCCEYEIPAGTKSASVGGQPLALPKAKPEKIVVLGDTGCRIKGSDVQNCNGKGTGPVWAWDQVAQAAMNTKPDLVIHVGDYLYRESACPDGNPGCAGSPHGDNWPTWDIDFFKPAGDLLSDVPWVFVRGNHEECTRAWMGYFYFLDPNPLPSNPWQNCNDQIQPYAVTVGDFPLVILDTSDIPHDYAPTPDPDAVKRYTGQLNIVNDLAGTDTAWVATHRPFWGISGYLDNGKVASNIVDHTLQAALAATTEKKFVPAVKLALAGHVHCFEKLSFEDGRPAQVISGAGGTMLDPLLTESYLNANADMIHQLGMDREDFQYIHNFTFLLMTPAQSGGWDAVAYTIHGTPQAGYHFE